MLCCIIAAAPLQNQAFNSGQRFVSRARNMHSNILTFK